MIKKFLFVGYGNMTKKYCNILKKLKKETIVKFYTKQNVINNLYNNINELKSYDPDIIFICSATVNHYKHLNFINKTFKNKIVIVEKPLFHKNLKLKNIKNKIYVSFNLRYDPLLQYLKKIIKNQKIWSLEVFCKSYLPNWRKTNYSKSYSAKKKLGGGVLLDLSHELDYVNWLFGEIDINYVVNNKISDLNINSDDNFLLVGKSKNIKQILIHLNYYSKIENRSIFVTSKNLNFKADIKNKEILFLNNKLKKSYKTWKDKDYKKSFEKIIEDIVFDKKIKLPDYEFNLKVQKLISNIQNQR